MTVRFEGKVDSASIRRVREAISRTPNRVAPLMKAEFTRWGQDWKRNVENRFTGSTGAASLHGRTGNLQKSLRSDVSGSSIGDLHLRCVSAGFNYARAQEYGATIVPKNKRFLTIPTDENKSAAGVARYPTVASLIAAFPGRTFFMRPKGKPNTLLLMLKDARVAQKGKAALRKTINKNAPGSNIPMFVLVKKSTIPGPKSTGAQSRLGFFDEWAKLGADRRSGLARNVARQLGRAG